jgi:creatinine amidohydrolase
LKEEVCERTDELLLPSLKFGMAEHHRNILGTLYVSPDTLRDVVYETLHSLTDHGIEKVVVINRHDSNTSALDELCGRMV